MMSENGEKHNRPGIERVTIDKKMGSTITLGNEGPTIELVPDPGSESGLVAKYNGEVFPLHHGGNTIGRLECSDIVVRVPTVSREHAIVGVGDREYTVSDSGSTHGTYLA